MPVSHAHAMSVEAVKGRLAEQSRLIDQTLEQYVAPDDASPEIVYQAMRHSVFAGGERLRPVLVLGGAEVAGAPPETVLPAACAVELIQTYSRIHDDLLAVDTSPVRRDQPPCHALYGDAIAVLAGDALHALAFELLAKNAEVPGVPATRVVRAITEVTGGIWTRGMVGGQVLDLLAARGSAGPVDVGEIHRLKTGSLIQAAVRIGGILAGAPPEDLEALGGYGGHLGLTFQIVDDVLAAAGEEAEGGKAPERDAAQAKVTFPSVFGLAESRQLAQETAGRAVQALEPLGARGQWLADLARYLGGRAR